MTPAALSALIKGDIRNFVAASTPGGIEAQEKAGQIEQSFLTTLPKEGTSGDKRKIWEALGFVFQDEADDIFVNTLFPVGWRKRPTEHDMWSDLLDAKDRKRGSIFYKAAFYDRHAHVHLQPRFSVGSYQSDNKVTIKDAGVVMRVVGEHPAKDWAAMDILRKEAHQWLEPIIQTGTMPLLIGIDYDHSPQTSLGHSLPRPSQSRPTPRHAP